MKCVVPKFTCYVSSDIDLFIILLYIPYTFGASICNTYILYKSWSNNDVWKFFYLYHLYVKYVKLSDLQLLNIMTR